MSKSLVRSGLSILGVVLAPVYYANPPKNEFSGSVKLPVIDKHDIRFDRLSVNGEPLQSRILNIVQDGYGFLWLGSSDGLYKYDGYTLRPYRHEHGNPNSVADDFLTALHKDGQGFLWIGSKAGGLDRLDPGRDTFLHYRHKADNPGSLGSDEVVCIYSGPSKELWIGTTGGLSRLEAASGKFVTYRHDPNDPRSLSNNTVTAVYEDRQGNVWVGTVAGLNKLERSTGRFSRFLHDPSNPHSIGHDYVSSILQDRAGVLWFGSSFGSGLSALDVKSGEFKRYSFHAEEPSGQSVAGVHGLFEDRDGALWLCTIDRGLIKLDSNREVFTRYASEPGNPYSLPNDAVYTEFEDAEGELWVGTQNGVARFQPGPPKFVNYRYETGNPNSLHNEMIWSVCADRLGCLWIGNEDGLDRLDPRTGQFTFYEHHPNLPYSLSYNKIEAIREDRSGTVWFGTYGGGLNRFDRTSGRFYAYRHNARDPSSLSNDSILSLLVDRQGSLWVGTQGGGLDRFDSTTGRFTSYFNEPPNPDLLFSVLSEDRAGMLWLGTPGQGLIRFDPRTKQSKTYHHDSDDTQSLSNNKVNAILEDRQGRLWVGTQNGFNLFDRSRGTATIFTKSDGLPDPAIESILEDRRGYLWLGTHNGISRFDPKLRTFRNYSEADGLAGNLLNPYGAGGSYQSSTGEMVFGSSKGVTTFYPERLSENHYVPPIVLTNFLLFNRPVEGHASPLSSSISATDSIALTHRQSIFTLEFAALSYTSPERNRYRYRLEGLEAQWNEVDSTRRSATYTNLAAKKYLFRLQGSNNDGIWNSEGATLAITVLPPWWATWWFRSILSVTIAALAFAAYRARMRQLNFVFEERLAERTRIAQELHDTLIQDMVAIGLQLDILQDHTDDEASAISSPLNVVRKRVRQAISRGRHTLLDLRSSRASTKDLIESLSCVGMELSTGDAPRFQAFVQGSECNLHSLIWHELDRIGREAITNAFRHAHARSIEVGLFGSKHAVQLVVRDDGCGMTSGLISKGRPGHFGLPGMRERAERAGGQLTVRSRPSGGTEVSVRIPLRGSGKNANPSMRAASAQSFGRWIEPSGSLKHQPKQTESRS